MADASSREPVDPSAFRADPAAVYPFVAGFFASMRSAGVAFVCISPGSRSTPLAIAAEHTQGLRTFVGLDERASSFFALGLAKAARTPVAILCTSGTAAANYLPAIIEAHYSRVPLIVLTADRPPELRDWGAGQTIEQQGLYGRYVRWASEVPMAGAGEDGLRYATRLGARAVDEAVGVPAGPVHLNWPFREPLAPQSDLASEATAARVARAAPLSFSQAHRSVADVDVDRLVELARSNERGVICCGPMDADGALVRAVRRFAHSARWPVLADPASQLRGDRDGDGAPVLTMGDGLLRAPEFARAVRPDVVVRVGETPVSKAQRLWIEASAPVSVWWVDDGGAWGEPSHLVTDVVRGGAASLFDRASSRSIERTRDSDEWCRRFERAERSARKAFDAVVGDPQEFSSLTVARAAVRAVGDDGTLFASNSMAIRLLDLAHDASEAAPRILCSRGASGIDGITSTALGVAAASSGRTLLLTGDLALLHDLSGLLVTRHEVIDLVIVVIDDDGGGIFSFLPIASRAAPDRFERLFGTPHGLDLERVADLFELEYSRVSNEASLEAALVDGFAQPGVHLVHVPLDRETNTDRFRRVLAHVAQRVDAETA